MNTLKSIVVIAVLGVVAYGVYVTLSEQPEVETPDWLPPDVAGNLSSPDVQMGDASGVPPIGGDMIGGDPLANLGDPSAGMSTAAGSESTGEGPVTATPNLDASSAQANYGGIQNDPSADPLDGARYPETGLPPNEGGNPLNGDQSSAGGSVYGTQLASAVETDSVYRRDASQASADPADMATAGGFGKSMEAAQKQLASGDLPMALLTLSFWYDHPKLTAAEEDQLQTLLDQLAGTVIYSPQSYIETPHRVSQYERLADVADKWQITPELLAKINAIDPGSRPEPGTELKIVRGPFDAKVNLSKQTLTLMVGGRYAGRFPIRTSSQFQPNGRRYFVQLKTKKAAPVTRCIELASGASPGTASGEALQIIGCDDPALLQTPEYANAIMVSSLDGDDIFDILTEQSRVTIE